MGFTWFKYTDDNECLGSYTRLEAEFNSMSSDELNELYLSGKMENMLDDYENDIK